jgi:hypothetical protein
MKLDAGQKHLLRLTAKGASENGGWAPVSKLVWPLIAALPNDLIEKQPAAEGGLARLTEAGETVLFYS